MQPLFERERAWLLEEKYKGKETPEFRADVEALQSGVPLAYLIGTIPFCGCTIDLSEKPLIPRVETEYWVNEFIQRELENKEMRRGSAAPRQASIQILDIFSGSGCIGIAVLKNTMNTSVDFAELNPACLRQIEKNLALNAIATGRYAIHSSDMFQNIPEKKYDYILANPPYIAPDRNDTVEKSVMDHEDHTALFADEDGLYFIKKLIEKSRNYLAPAGKTYIEFDSWQKEKLEGFLKELDIPTYAFLKDQYEKDRVLVLGLSHES